MGIGNSGHSPPLVPLTSGYEAYMREKRIGSRVSRVAEETVVIYILRQVSDSEIDGSSISLTFGPNRAAEPIYS